MKISIGLFDHMVLQCNRRSWSDAPMTNKSYFTKNRLYRAKKNNL